MRSRSVASWFVALTTAGVLFCGMFPFDFVFHVGSAAQDVRHRFDTTINQLYTAGDGLENVIFFVPTGFALAALMWNGERRRWQKLVVGALVTVGVGLGLSSVVELSQVFLVSRDPSLADICSNTTGAAIGFALFVGIGPAVMRAIFNALHRLESVATQTNLFVVACLWLAAGVLLPLTRHDAGSLSGWNPGYSLLVGNETTGDRSWNGTLRSAALLDRGLNDDEVDRLLSGDAPASIGSGLLSDYRFTGRGPYADAAGHGATLHWATGHSVPAQTDRAKGFNAATEPAEPSPPLLGGPAGSMQVGAPTGDGWWLRGDPGDQSGGEAAVAQQIAKADAFSLFIDVQTDDLGQHDGPPRIISLSGDTHRCNFQLLQEADALVIRLRTVASGEGGSDPEFVLPNVFDDVSPRRIVVTFDHGRLAAATDHTGDRAAFRFTPEATLIWLAYPRDGWAFRLDSAGQSACAKIYRIVIAFPVALVAGWAMRRGRLDRESRPRKISKMMVILISAVALESTLAIVDGRLPAISSVAVTLAAATAGVFGTGKFNRAKY